MRPRIFLVKIPARNLEIVTTAMTADLALREVATTENSVPADMLVFELAPTEIA
ncbi:MAG TPA: hypothetical protein PLB34_17465 [Rhodoblastus sp.]|nr:hypothetical protein [Rhodoblastus sp.]